MRNHSIYFFFKKRQIVGSNCDIVYGVLLFKIFGSAKLGYGMHGEIGRRKIIHGLYVILLLVMEYLPKCVYVKFPIH